MKKLILPLLALFITTNTYCQGDWFLQNSGTTTLLYTVYFTSGTVGWMGVGTSDNTKHLRYTNDGGNSWNPVPTGITDSWTAMYFTSWDVGYLAGWNGNIVKVTYNPGEGKYEFTLQKHVSATLQDIYFFNSSTGWAVGSGGKIYKTANSGLTWDEQTSNTENSLYAVYFTDTDYGWAVGDNGTIVHTTDGGTNWNLQNSPHSSWQYGIQFFDRNNGWIAADTKLLHTTDGGTTWQYVSSSIITNLFVHFTDPLNGWVCGNWGYISHTNDGGQNWYTQNSNTDASFMGMFFYDSYTGWIVGSAGKIIKTTTGGCEIFTADLGPDTSICYGKSFTFYAPYGNGYKYSWNTGSTDFYLTAATPGTYSVNATNTCNTTHSDAVNLVVHPLPVINLGSDKAFCFGGSVTLDAGPGYKYLWTGGSADQTLIVNSTGTYIGKITDDNTCQNSDTVSILVHPLPIINLGTDLDLCENQSAVLDAGPSLEYLWDDGSTGQLREVSEAGAFFVKISDNNLCENYDTIQVQLHPLPKLEIQADGPSKLCKGEVLNLDAVILNNDGISNYQYSWNEGPALAIPQFQVETAGTYNVIVTEDHGCSDTAGLEVNYQYPFENEKIGVVTYNLSLGKNLVVWQKTADKGTRFYEIYKVLARDTIHLGDVDYNDLTVFTDFTSNPRKESDRYVIKVVDTCGNKSLYSESHKTIHLTANKGTSSEINLIWEHYEGITIDWYYIFRGTDSTAMSLIDSISYDISKTQYTDLNPPAGVVYYQIGIKLPEVIVLIAGKKADSGPYSHSMSNIEDNRFQTGIKEMDLSRDLLIYPNPFSETTTLKFSNTENGSFKLKIFDLTGKVLREINDLSGTEYILGKGELQKGYYIIELSGNMIYRGRIVVE